MSTPPPPPSLVLVVPCHDEAARFDPRPWREFLDRHPDARVLFVDDGSADDTAAAVASVHPRAAALTLPRNVGKGEAVRAGVLAADAAVVGYWDADLATPLDAVDALLAELADPAVELVMGARVRMLGWRIDRRPLRHYLGRVAATAASLTLGLPVYDTQCGAKLLRGDLARTLFAEPFLTRWMFDVELLARLRRRVGDAEAVERRVHEVPLRRWEDVAGSRLRWTDVLAVPWQLLRIWARYRRG